MENENSFLSGKIDYLNVHEDNNQLHFSPLTTPFQKIGMALSGGGFRASSYSIGTMSYLNSLQYEDEKGQSRSLLDNVEFISSASGGTFAAILYSSYAKKGIPFEQAYKDLLKFMEGQSLLEEVLQLINDDKEWTDEEKNRNFINAFAKIYDRKLFKGETFGVYWNDYPDPVQSKSIEICFNATEFYRGISFRFQTGSTGAREGTPYSSKTGNNYLYFDKMSAPNLETLKHIKLGDIMASSSCFPAGFEPMVYPYDFTYSVKDGKKGLTSKELSEAMIITDYEGKERVLDTSFGLMDGGIDDNQGLYSAILADKRRRESFSGNGFDLIMITDVASYFMEPYIPPANANSIPGRQNITGLFSKISKGLTLFNKAVIITGIVSLVSLLASIAMIVFVARPPWHDIGLLLLSPSILLLLLTTFILGFKAGNPIIKNLTGYFSASDGELAQLVKEKVSSVNNFSDDTLKLIIKYLKNSPVSVLQTVLKTRVNSMLSLVMDINLKQTRRLIFDIFFGSFYGKEIWENRSVFNVIYELSTFNKLSRAAVLTRKFKDGKYNPHQAGIDPAWTDKCLRQLQENCKELNAVAERARTMGTTLWFDAKNMERMKDVVACGQFTSCAKLLEYVFIIDRILTIEKSFPEEKKSLQFGENEVKMFQHIKSRIESDWEKFKANPYFLFEQYQQK